MPGHWEGDLFFGSNNSQIATLVERHTRYLMLVRVTGKDTETVVDALIKQALKLPRELYKSLTWDRGKEMADHKRFSLATDVKVYFCDPQQPWQRGSNENTNGLLRQYFPKGMDLSDINQNRLNAVARRLNEQPGKHSTSKRRLNNLANVLRRSVESAADCSRPLSDPKRTVMLRRSAARLGLSLSRSLERPTSPTACHSRDRQTKGSREGLLACAIRSS